jgi:predicted enzyme related to lactoylglutathione lyase
MSKFNGNAITWFEVPTTDIERAVGFYETLLDRKLQQHPGDEPYFIFPAQEGSVAGALIQRPHQKPAADGTMVFLNVDGQLDEVLTRAHKIEGTVLLPKTQIPGGSGYYACVMDSEGNHIGLHSR